MITLSNTRTRTTELGHRVMTGFGMFTVTRHGVDTPVPGDKPCFVYRHASPEAASLFPENPPRRADQHAVGGLQ